MHMLDFVRWQLVLALVGALLVHWLPWQIAALVVGTIAFEHGARIGYRRMRRRLNAITPDDPAQDRAAAGIAVTKPAFVTMRLPMALSRLFGVQCPLCQGVGCGECAQTGLR